MKAIVAMSSNRAIGKDGGLPWHLPEDLKWFKKITMGHPIVMGRKTAESIGRPLPGRENIIVSRALLETPEGFTLVNDPDAIETEIEPFVIGGAEIFESMISKIDEFFLTYIFEAHEGDTFLEEGFFDDFHQAEVLETNDLFEIRRYVR